MAQVARLPLSSQTERPRKDRWTTMTAKGFHGFGCIAPSVRRFSSANSPLCPQSSRQVRAEDNEAVTAETANFAKGGGEEERSAEGFCRCARSVRLVAN